MRRTTIEVGIISGDTLTFDLPAYYTMTGRTGDGTSLEQRRVSGLQRVTLSQGRMAWDGRLLEQLCFTPEDDAETSGFELYGVVVGKQFHWEHLENQRFRGALKCLVAQDRLMAVNVVDCEAYLASVISSEMNPDAPLEFLKAQAVVARSWMRRMMEEPRDEGGTERVEVVTDDECLRWYDCRAHACFDVCADDHCQRYQGITRTITPAARQAVAATRGEVLTYGDEICDARFSKCCGGVTEEFQYCWDDVYHPYLASRPDPYCAMATDSLLSRALTAGDQATHDFLHWEVRYTQDELASLIYKRSGINLGHIVDLEPVVRGKSGRLCKLRIVGTHGALVIGKELEIRRLLSPTHLYSSNFTVELVDVSPEAIPSAFILRGKGWGHGVGLCQIGAAVMADQGRNYHEILAHYYPGATIGQCYEES